MEIVVNEIAQRSSAEKMGVMGLVVCVGWGRLVSIITARHAFRV